MALRNFQKILTVSVMTLCVTAVAMAGEILTGFKYAQGSPENPILVTGSTINQYAAAECMQTVDFQKGSLRQGFFTITDSKKGATCFKDEFGKLRISSGVCVGVYAATGATTQIRCDQVTQ